MAISRGFSRKAASMAPMPFFECKESGGPHGGTGAAPARPKGGAQREKIYGRPELDRAGGKKGR